MIKAQRYSFAVLIFSVTVSYLSVVGRAQALAAGSVSGAVFDSNGAVVPNAGVTLSNPITGYKRAATTNADGTFRFADVPPNNYQLAVTATGFSAATQTVTVRTAVPIALKIPLEVSSTTDCKCDGQCCSGDRKRTHNAY